jgi:predicted transcriptional regulator
MGRIVNVGRETRKAFRRGIFRSVLRGWRALQGPRMFFPFIDDPAEGMDIKIDKCQKDGNTLGMKMAISLPDSVFERAERFAHARRKTRSAFYAEAIEEYLERHSPDEITDAMNAVCEKIGIGEYAFAERAAKTLFAGPEW